MATSAGSVVVDVGANTSNFDRKMRDVDSRLNRLERTSSTVTRGFGTLGRGIDRTQGALGRVSRGASSAILSFVGLRGAVLAASGGFLGGAGLVYAMQKAVGIAINLEEQTNKLEVVFGRSAAALRRWSKSTATGIGIARVAALEAAGTFGNMLRPLGVIPKQAAVMSKALVNLAGDMSSFNNASVSETLDAIRAGLAGETEPLRRFGVFLSEARLKTEALRSGLIGPGFKGVLDPLVRTFSAYNLILKDTKLAQGDYNRTANSSANVIRTVKAQVSDLAGLFGKGLEPVVNRVGRALRDKLADPATQASIQRIGRLVGEKLMSALERLGQWFEQHWPGIKDGFAVAGQTLNIAADAATRLASALRRISEDTPGGLATLLGVGLGAKALAGRRGGRGSLTGAVVAGALTAPTPVKVAVAVVATGGAGGARNYSAARYPALAELLGSHLFNRYAPALVSMADGPTIATSSPRALGRMEKFAKGLGFGKNAAAGFDREERRAAVQRGERRRKEAMRRAETYGPKPITSTVPLQTAAGSDAVGKSKVKAEARKAKATSDPWSPMTTLFGGPFLTGEAFSVASSFGYQAKPTDLLRDLRGQNAQLTTLVRSANRLRRRGAPSSLTSELLAGGVENADEAAALAGASPKVFRQYLKAFGNRQRLEERVHTMSVGRLQTNTIHADRIVVAGGSGNPAHRGQSAASKRALAVGARRGGKP